MLLVSHRDKAGKGTAEAGGRIAALGEHSGGDSNAGGYGYPGTDSNSYAVPDSGADHSSRFYAGKLPGNLVQ